MSGLQRATKQTPEEARAAVIDLVTGDDLGYTYCGSAGTTYKAWLTEHEYRLLTSAERKALRSLLDEGAVVHEAGWRVRRRRVIARRGHELRA